MMPVSVPPPADDAHAAARPRAAWSRIDEPELRVIVAEPPETMMPTLPDGFCSRASFEDG